MSFGQSDIQALINQVLGYGADVLGQLFDWFRAIGPGSPLDPACRMGTLQAYLDPDPMFAGKKPSGYNKPLWGVLCDRTATLPGDYLQGDQGTFFLIAQQPLLPTLAVECNALVSVARPGGVSSIAQEDSYGGRTQATDVPLLTGWPASVLAGSRGQESAAGLPADASMKGKEILLPPSASVELRVGDLVTTSQGERLTLSSCERTDLGWRASGVISEV